jgi:hypothetical protein
VACTDVRTCVPDLRALCVSSFPPKVSSTDWLVLTVYCSDEVIRCCNCVYGQHMHQQRWPRNLGQSCRPLRSAQFPASGQSWSRAGAPKLVWAVGDTDLQEAGSANVLCAVYTEACPKHMSFFSEKVYFFSPTSKVRFFSLNLKTGQTTFLNFSNSAFYLPRAVLKEGLLQACSKRWFCYSVRVFFWLNLWKIIVNHRKS